VPPALAREFPRRSFALYLLLLTGYVVDSMMDSLVLIQRNPAHPVRIPALWFRPLFALCSPLLTGYIVDSMIVTGFWFLVQKAKMG
jgi:hypothetical protein